MSVQVVVSKYKENIDWIKSSPYDVVVYSKLEGEPNYVKDGQDGETSSYLHHIIENYDNLSEWTVFVHGHEYHWHHPLSVLKSFEIDLSSIDKRCKFFSINHGEWGVTYKYDDEICKIKNLPIMIYEYTRLFSPIELTVSEYCQVMKDIFGEDEYKSILEKYFPNEELLRSQKFPPCAQFYVHRDRIQARPKSFYEHCFKLLTTPDYIFQKTHQGAYSKRSIGPFFFEANWHYIFGEDYLYDPFYKNYQDFPFKIQRIKHYTSFQRTKSIRSWFRLPLCVVILMSSVLLKRFG